MKLVSLRMAISLALVATATGCGAGSFRPMGVEAGVSTGKFKAKSLHAANSRFSKHHLLVRAAAGAKPPVAGARVKQALGELQVHELPKGMTVEQALPAYQAAAGVRGIEKLELYPMEEDATTPAPPAIEVPKSAAPDLGTNDARYFEQWSHQVANVQHAWSIHKGRPEVLTAVLDTGVDYTHPDLAGQVVNGPDFAEGKDDSRDIDQHGTHVAGIIAAKAGNGMGVAGVAPGTRVLALKVFEPYFEDGKFQGTFYNALSLARAVQYAATQGGAKVINISAGIANEEIVETMLSFARGRGLIICVSAGNKGSNTYTGNPKYIDGVLAVHATDPMDRLARFSNYGTTMGVSAPGMGILSTVPTYANPYTGEPGPPDGYDRFNGTSMASPFVAGLSALVVSGLMDAVEDQIRREHGKTVQLAPEHIPGTIVEDLVRLTCKDLGRPGRDETYGAGRVDAGRAMEAAMSPEWVDRATSEVLRNLKR